jgi:hypothetical protein
MKRVLLASFAFLLGCGGSLVHPDTALERVVIYRNGVAYFERSARVGGDHLTVRVRGSDVDDFLKSLSVVDARTHASIPVEYPSSASQSAYGAVDMTIQLPGAAPHDVQLSYVTEAPAWKPTYRAVLGEDGRVTLEGLAIVDNASDEDWKDIKLAVAASAALSFRFDLRSIRFMRREVLDSGVALAAAPPAGGVPYGGEPAGPRVVGEVSAEALAAAASPLEKLAWARRALPGMEQARDAIARMVSIARDQRDVVKLLCESDKLKQVDVSLASARERVTALEAAVDREDAATATHESTVIQVLRQRVEQITAESRQCVGEEAAFLGETVVTMVDPGLPGDEEQAVRAAPGFASSPRSAPPLVTPPSPTPPREPVLRTAPAGGALSTEPVGSGHFEAPAAATIASGQSAMVSVFKHEAQGDLVYFYDRESAHGNETYPFLSLRFRNPTAEALEGGPFTVFGHGRLIGEGIADSIPGSGVAFVPFALDRQIVVTRKELETDEIARVVGMERGVLSAEMTHVRTARLTIQNRLSEAATVYLKHTVTKGAALRDAPKSREKLGNAELFRVEVAAGGEAEVVIEETSMAAKTVDPGSREGSALVRAYVASPAADPGLKETLSKLLATSSALDGIDERIATARAELAGYKERKTELERQIAALRGPPGAAAGRSLATHLEKKLAEAEERIVAMSVDLVALAEKRLWAVVSRDEAFRLAASGRRP